jgi:hypothetical protein
MKLQIQTAVKTEPQAAPFDHPPGRHYNLNRDAWLTGKVGAEFIAENGGAPGVRLRKAAMRACMAAAARPPLGVPETKI